MDPSPPPPPSLLPNHPTAVTSMQLNYPDSADSSPRKADTSWDEPLPAVPGAKLRLMCSYGGHIIPRPHDKSLCYMGGETRMIVVDRSSSLLELSSRISRTLLNGRGFTLKYQLPNEDLDSLISVTTNEDLDNMIEEYDRITAASPLKSPRLRLFLFLAKPETAASMGALLDDAKSETWFVDALNGAGLMSRGLSDSAAIDCLLEGEGNGNGDSGTNSEAQTDSLCSTKNGKSGQEVHSLPSSPMVETASSFGSSSSSPSMANLPPIRVRVEDSGLRLHDHKVGLEEEFAYMSTNPQTMVQKQDEGFFMLSAPPPLPSSAIVGGAAAESGENPIRVFSDDERSDHGVRVRCRKPPLPLQPVQRRLDDGFNLPSPDSKHGGGLNFPSPDSVARYPQFVLIFIFVLSSINLKFYQIMLKTCL